MNLPRTLSASLIAASLAAQPAHAASASPAAVADDFVAAWNLHDARNFTPLFTDDAWWVPVAEARLVGRAQIVADLQQAHAIWAGRTTLSAGDVAVAPLSDAAAVVLFKAPFLDKDGRRVEPPNVLMLVVVKSADGWRIRAGQLTKPGQTALPAREEKR